MLVDQMGDFRLILLKGSFCVETFKTGRHIASLYGMFELDFGAWEAW
jgi:hypothetical protein